MWDVFYKNVSRFHEKWEVDEQDFESRTDSVFGTINAPQRSKFIVETTAAPACFRYSGTDASSPGATSP